MACFEIVDLALVEPEFAAGSQAGVLMFSHATGLVLE